MSATATPPNALEKSIADLTVQGATLAEAVKEVQTLTKTLLAKPDYSGLRAGDPADEGQSISYWDNSSPMPIVVDGKTKFKSMKRGLPKGYKNDVYKSLGDFLQDGYRNHKSADWQSKHQGIFKAIQGMSEQVASDGGYLVLPEFNQNIFAKVYDNGDLLGMLDQYTVAGNNMRFLRSAETSRANGSRWGGLRAYWTDEGASTTDTKPTMKGVQLNLKKLCVIVYLTEEALADATALEQFATRSVADEINFVVGDAIFNGVGGGMPLGIMNSGALLSIAKEAGQLADTIVAPNIDKMWARRYAAGSYNWYTNQDTHPELSSMTRVVGAAGDLVFNPPGGLSAAPYATLKGAPIKETEFQKTLGDQGDLLLADLSKIVCITKGGINQAVSTHVEFLTGQTALRFTFRIDFRPWEDSPVTPYNGTATQSSFVTLDARA